MDYKLLFSESYEYDSRSEGVTIPAMLTHGTNRDELLAKIDTGASECFFMHSYGEALGLHVEEGFRKQFKTVTGPFVAYGHEVSIRVRRIEITSMVYFFADPTIERSVLGLNGWLQRVRFGLIHYEQSLYLADYNS